MSQASRQEAGRGKAAVGRQPFAANEINLCFVGMGMPTYCSVNSIGPTNPYRFVLRIVAKPDGICNPVRNVLCLIRCSNSHYEANR